jgi:hypothetical protein
MSPTTANERSATGDVKSIASPAAYRVILFKNRFRQSRQNDTSTRAST